jgi:predicted glycoside hydrolase/deacetylase ChbG (UPF0249 family)
MSSKRCLIVNADDFGQSLGINRGIIEAYENGIVTSASLMVRWPAAAEAAAYAREHRELSLGLHLDLCEWICRDGDWEPLYEVAPLDDGVAIAEEITRQVSTCREFIGQDPSHLDSHQHVHRAEPVRSIMVDVARQLGVPLRDCSPSIRYCGEFYGQSGNGYPYPDSISVEGLIKTLAELPTGITELGCHPGLGDDLDTMYGKERIEEVKALCDPRVRAAIIAGGIELYSFHNIAKAWMTT